MQGYMYAGLWIVIGLILIVSMAKENKIFILAGAALLILTAAFVREYRRRTAEAKKNGGEDKDN